MKLSIIVAISQNGVIGRNGGLPWHISADLRRFKALTMGHHIIMGRRTFESLGRSLPGRTTVVVSENGWKKTDVVSVRSLDEALCVAERDDEPFVIGGHRLFESARPIADRLYLTRVLSDIDGDTYLNLANWQLDDPKKWRPVEISDVQETPDGLLQFQFETWERAAQRSPIA